MREMESREFWNWNLSEARSKPIYTQIRRLKTELMTVMKQNGTIMSTNIWIWNETLQPNVTETNLDRSPSQTKKLARNKKHSKLGFVHTGPWHEGNELWYMNYSPIKAQSSHIKLITLRFIKPPHVKPWKNEFMTWRPRWTAQERLKASFIYKDI